MITAKNSVFLKTVIKKLSGEDVREGITAIISVKLTEAQFEGQTKGKLGNTEITGLVSSMVYEKLLTYFEENPQLQEQYLINLLMHQEQERQQERQGIRQEASQDWKAQSFPENWRTVHPMSQNFAKSIS